MKNSNLTESLNSHFRAAPWWILLILLLVTIGNVTSIFAIDIHPDEAYYWAWSVYPDASYVDHPPMVAWMIWLTGKVIGINNFTLRLPALLSWLVGLICVYKISERLYANKLHGWLAVAIFSILPVFQAASHIITPDSPLLLFVALTYYFLLPAQVNGSSREWYLAGAMTGLGLLSKYNAVLLPGIVFIALISTESGRKQLKQAPPWIAILLAGVLFLPVIYWNFRNDWISFAFQLGHGVGSRFSLANVGVFFGGQLGAALIWMMLLMMLASFRLVSLFKDNRKTYLVTLVSGFWVPLLFFGYASGTTVGQVNWPAMAYFPGTILLAGMFGNYVIGGVRAGKQNPRIIIASVLLVSCLFSATLVNIFRFPVQAKEIGLGFLPTNTQLSDTFGWSELKKKIEMVRKEHHLDPGCRVYLSTRYMWGSMIYRFRDVEHFAMLPGTKVSQYPYWVSRHRFSDREPCLAIVRFPLEQKNYPVTREWEGLGKWRLIDTLEIPTSDTPRIYGFYLPVKR